MRGLITDRTQYNVSRRATLSAKGWSGMTQAERIEWSGDPLVVTGANLLPYGPNYSSTVELKYRDDVIEAEALVDGVYLYSISIIGDSANYAGKTFTLSAKNMEAPNGGLPQIALYWHDDTGFEYAGASLMVAGSTTFNTADFPNVNNRKNLAAYIYVTAAESVVAGTVVRFTGVMLENGSVKHEYVPYTEILPTDTTKGSYNYSDLNRVERTVSAISDLGGLGLVTRTNWAMWDVPTASEMARYLGNIVAIKNHYSIEGSLPSSMSNLTYTDANNIEKILSIAAEKVGLG